jgi:hypothetical protein
MPWTGSRVHERSHSREERSKRESIRTEVAIAAAKVTYDRLNCLLVCRCYFCVCTESEAHECYCCTHRGRRCLNIWSCSPAKAVWYIIQVLEGEHWGAIIVIHSLKYSNGTSGYFLGVVLQRRDCDIFRYASTLSLAPHTQANM